MKDNPIEIVSQLPIQFVVIDFITDIIQASIKKNIAPVIMYVGTGKVILTLEMYVARDWMLPVR